MSMFKIPAPFFAFGICLFLVFSCQDSDNYQPPPIQSLLIEHEVSEKRDTVFYIQYDFLKKIKSLKKGKKWYRVNYDSVGNISKLSLDDSMVFEFNYLDSEIEVYRNDGIGEPRFFKRILIDSVDRVVKISSRNSLPHLETDVTFFHNSLGNLFKAVSLNRGPLKLHPERLFSKNYDPANQKNPLIQLPHAIKFFIAPFSVDPTPFLYFNCYSNGLLDSAENRISSLLNPGETSGFKRRTMKFEFHHNGYPIVAKEKIQNFQYVYPDTLNLNLLSTFQENWYLTHMNYGN